MVIAALGERVRSLVLSARVRLLLLAVLVLGGVIALAVLGAPGPARIEGVIRDAGPAAPLMFVLVYAVLTVLVFPGSVLTVAGGFVFGPALGTVLGVLGASLGSVGAYLVGRRLGRARVSEIAGGRLASIDGWLERRGFLAVLYARLVPIVPFTVLNYAAAVTSVRFRDYLAATVLGIVPGTFAYAALGGSFQHPTSPTFLTAVGMIVALAVAGPLVQRWNGRRGRGDRGAPRDRRQGS